MIGIDDITIRLCLSRDIPAVLAIEDDSFEYPWSTKDFEVITHQRNISAYVADYLGDIIGFVVYEKHQNRIELLNLAVDISYRRCGVGRKLVSSAISKLNKRSRRQCIATYVRETNLAAQLFLSECGFIAVDIIYEYYDTGEPAYLMDFRQGWPVEV